VFGYWWGGSGYSLPDSDDLEEFASVDEARQKLSQRYRDGYWYPSRFRFVHRKPVSALTPCVGDDCEITLYRSREAGDQPDMRIFLGPRGGVRCEPC
jgi:hypothetical protein